MIKKSNHHSHIVGNLVYHQPQLCRQRKPGPTQLVDKFIHVTGILNTIVLNTSMSFQEHRRQDEGVASASEDLCVATRVHSQLSSELERREFEQNMQSFIENTLGYAGHVFIALHVTLDDIQDKDKKSTFGSATKVLKSLTDQEQTKVTLVPILSWGRFTTALNTLLTKAAQLQYKYILYKSFEVRLSQKDALLMKDQVDTAHW